MWREEELWGGKIVRLKKRLARFERLEVEEEEEVEEVGGEDDKVEDLGEAKGWSGKWKKWKQCRKESNLHRGGVTRETRVGCRSLGN